MHVILAKEKHGNFVTLGDDGSLEQAAIKLLAERLLGDWYEDDDAEQAKAIVRAKDGKKAWAFLRERRDYEYEWVESQVI